MEHQRQTFDEERALWNTERWDLHEKIAQLEGTLRRYQALSSSQVSSPIDKTESGAIVSSWSLVSTNSSRNTSASGTGDEVWRGPKLDVQPTRRFSESSNQSTRPGHKLPSITEDATSGRKEDLEISLHNPGSFRKSSISGIKIDKNLDGINFKTTNLAPTTVQNAIIPTLTSPRSPSPSQTPPGTLPLPSNKLEMPIDLYTKDAGHTPLARYTFSADGPSSDSGVLTPKQPEIERPPLEPRATTIKTPSERSDSYFPVAEDIAAEDPPPPGEDPELKGPLGLQNSPGEDKHFLNELDLKLLQASKSKAFSLRKDEAAGLDKENSGDVGQPEHEPQLRIKRSMNFGSAFGAKSCGKGI